MTKLPLPRWDSRDERDKEAMRRWVNERLDQELETELKTPISSKQADAITTTAERIAAERPEIVAAEHGDIEPLRKLLQQTMREKFGDNYPDLAPYLRLRALKRGEHRMGPMPSWRQDVDPSTLSNPFLTFGLASEAEKPMPVQCAADDILRIQKIWREAYGRKNRTTDPKAEQIAAERWGVTLSDIENEQRRRAELKKRR